MSKWRFVFGILLSFVSADRVSAQGYLTPVPGVAPNAQGQVPSMAGGIATSTIWVPSATVAIGTSDTSCFSGTGRGPGQTITPVTGIPYVGNQFSLYCSGVFSTPTINTATMTVKIKWGTTTVATATSSGLQATATNLQWTLSGLCTVIAISATPSASTVICNGQFTYAQGVTGSSVVTTALQAATPATPVSVDTTAAFKLDLTMAWSTQSGSPPQAATSLGGNVQIVE